jgi:two-component sensor histidine kinase
LLKFQPFKERTLRLHLSFLFLLFQINVGNLSAQITLKSLLIDQKNQQITPDKVVHLAENEADITLEFTEKNLNSAGYQYSLTEIGEKGVWEQSVYPTASFRDLDGGKFSFKIKPSGGNASEIFEMKIIKAPPFYQKWWFWPVVIFYGLAIIGVAFYLFFLYDFRQKLKMQHVRNQIAADLHDEVGSNLNSIAIFAELLRKNSPESNLNILDKITENSKESVTLMQDTVWMINPKNDSTEKLFDRMKSFASQILASKNISLQFDQPVELKKINFSMEQRKNCYLIFKEAINNIVKHAEATKVEVKISVKNEEVDILIEDNGKGFDLTEIHEGNGLQNFKERAEEAEFELNIDSVLEKGTKIGLVMRYE